MTDARLRELERKWHESGSAEDEAAWLRERVRVGDSSEGRLRLAAYWGHPPALEALQLSPNALSQPVAAVVSDLDLEERRRFLIALARLLPSRVEEWFDEEFQEEFDVDIRKLLEELLATIQ